MSWESISNIAPPKAAKVPPKGVAVTVRKLGTRSGAMVRYIRIAIGPALSKSLCLMPEEINMALALGGGEHAGMIGLSVDAQTGGFRAKRTKDGCYVLTVNAASADGLFSLDFPAFTAEATVVHAQNKPPLAAFRATPAMLEAD